MAIHPSAVVEVGAVVDPSCEVGPFVYVGPEVKLGPKCVLRPHAVVTGRTTLGASNRVFSHAVIGDIPQDLKYRGEPTRLEIGDGNTFREYVTVNSGTVQDRSLTTIGDRCLFMANSHVGHDCVVGNRAIVANSVGLSGHVVLEDDVHLGGLSGIHQFVRIGRLAFVSGVTGVSMDVAPFCTVAGARAELGGLNVVGMQRAGMSEEAIARVKQAYKVVFRSSLAVADALAALKAEFPGDPDVGLFVSFIEGSKRGVTR